MAEQKEFASGKMCYFGQRYGMVKVLRGLSSMLEVKARMIVPESETKGWAEELLEPLARTLKWLALAVQKHPVIAILILLALIFLAWRLHK